MPHLQQQFIALFSNLGGLEICLSAIECGVESAEYPDIKLKSLHMLLSLMSRVGLWEIPHALMCDCSTFRCGF